MSSTRETPARPKHREYPGHRTGLRQAPTGFPVGDRSLAASDRLSERALLRKESGCDIV